MLVLQDLENALEEFNTKYPRPNLEPLILSEKYNILEDFRRSYPGSQYPGVYAIFDSKGELLRIGKASCNSCLGARLSTYFEWHKTEYIGVNKHAGYEDAIIIRTIKLPTDRGFEAPALEEFLIGKLSPRFNTVGAQK
ncbi:hypothetical protein [Vibrio tritonius]|uniref:hypothetical protein n=1 Tax=Vibrio tritonius TaxID=1435069 RepID=UPI00315D57CE